MFPLRACCVYMFVAISRGSHTQHIASRQSLHLMITVHIHYCLFFLFPVCVCVHAHACGVCVWCVCVCVCMCVVCVCLWCMWCVCVWCGVCAVITQHVQAAGTNSTCLLAKFTGHNWSQCKLMLHVCKMFTPGFLIVKTFGERVKVKVSSRV